MGIALAIFGAVLSTIVVPLPEELALLGAGFWAHSGAIPLWGAWLSAAAAVLVGDTASYLAGRYLLKRLLATRLGKRLMSPGTQRWGENLVKQHSVGSILLARFLVGLRGPVYLAIGAARYPMWKFEVINTTVGLVEIGLLVGAGYWFGQSAKLAKEAHWIELSVGVTVALALVIPALVKRRVERRHTAAA